MSVMGVPKKVTSLPTGGAQIVFEVGPSQVEEAGRTLLWIGKPMTMELKKPRDTTVSMEKHRKATGR